MEAGNHNYQWRLKLFKQYMLYVKNSHKVKMYLVQSKDIPIPIYITIINSFLSVIPNYIVQDSLELAILLLQPP